MDHGLEHLSGDNDRPAGLASGARDLLLTSRHLFHRQLDAKVAASDHNAIGEFENLVELAESGRLLDLRHHAGPAANKLASLGHVVVALDERQSNPVHAYARGEFEITPILLGQGRHAYHRVGKVQAFAR